MYNLKTSARDRRYLSFDFQRDRERTQREFTENRKQKGKYHVRIMLRDNVGFAEHQKKATYGLG